MAGFIYLVELNAFHVTAPNIEWTLGAVETAGIANQNSINVLKT